MHAISFSSVTADPQFTILFKSRSVSKSLEVTVNLKPKERLSTDGMARLKDQLMECDSD